ncbi:Alpha/Beta hydrolase protein [Microdochium trichocladiopsis]|uniref:Alpha/Beta hydrolase protein n=1 Tax=Microdochium trichocladiopsis TaxID=1682393 RepID=A0A9P9BYN0_9PEZI|nr:Alpha/Beta hydrolase protein [Microdochium trichocladiopsis]KAH7038203.1 Alpha/Beta hydrolase protein [Microdochium trichocladiopsis]
MADIKPYTIAVPDSAIEDLKLRLSLAKFPDELEGAGWDMGVPLAEVQRLARHWQKSHDWRAAERELNKLPNYVTPIQCDGGFEALDIHFVHVRSSAAKAGQNAIPLLFVHGWPGHFQEVLKILKPLTEGEAGDDTIPVFDVVAPSLPNFGFSQGTKKRGFALEQYAETVHKLMLKLGYDEYVTQGGDWGCHITRALAHMYPSHCRATHINMDSCSPPSFLTAPLVAARAALTPHSRREAAGVARTKWFNEQGRGYNLTQSTKPQTIGYALADSPVACLSWIYEKLHDWTDAVGRSWTDDEVCTWVSMYWFSTAGPAASARIYYEATHNVDSREGKLDHERLRTYSPGVKLGFSHFPMDLVVLPRSWFATLGEVVFDREHESGGHFAAWERPKELVADVREMFGKGGGAFGCVKGKNGYA